MAESSTAPGSRPLARSLDPLAGESLGGYLLRLGYRLRLSPVRLARRTGCTTGNSATQLGRRLLLDLDAGRFARAACLTADEAAALTLIPWADRYPPIARSQHEAANPPWNDDWLFNDIARYCPRCLAGDGSTIQQEYGGTWKKAWHLPVAFACPDHGVLLEHGCPRNHLRAVIPRLITQPADSTLHPAQCRRLQLDQPPSRGRTAPSCGARLDRPQDAVALRPGTGVIEAQRRLLGLLGPRRPAEDAARFFTDVRVVTALLCASWPLGGDLIDPPMLAAVDGHVRWLGSGTRQSLDLPPRDPAAAAALLTAAVTILDTADLQGTVAHYAQQTTWKGRPSRAPWARVLSRHASSCSDALRQAAEPSVRAFRRTGRKTKAPARADGYRPEHVAAFLQENWYQQHLAPLGYGPRVRSPRRNAAVLLVQWAAGGSLGDAAAFLGINPDGGQYAPSPQYLQWLSGHSPEQFTAALHRLAADLGATAGLIDYRHRRGALQNWSLAPGAWQELTGRLPPVPGPVQPILDDRKRQEASAFIWARVTQGEPRFAPRPIEAMQPEPVRASWARHRGNTWSKLTWPGRLVHYAELRELLIEHASHLARSIDNSAEEVLPTGTMAAEGPAEGT
jgi:hypothetical protein